MLGRPAGGQGYRGSCSPPPRPHSTRKLRTLPLFGAREPFLALSTQDQEARAGLRRTSASALHSPPQLSDNTVAAALAAALAAETPAGGCRPSFPPQTPVNVSRRQWFEIDDV